MKTFDEIIKDVSHLKWSTIVREEAFANVEEYVKLAVRQAHAFIWQLNDFPFRIRRGGIMTAGSAFAAPKGDILEMWVQNSGAYLKKIIADDGDLLDSTKTGTPQLYWVTLEDSGAVVHLYPAPDKQYSLLYKYSTNYKARDMGNEEKANLTDATDTLNIPQDETLEDAYLQCLYTKSMVYLIADSTDENYAPYEKEFDEAYRNLLSVTGAKIPPKLVI